MAKEQRQELIHALRRISAKGYDLQAKAAGDALNGVTEIVNMAEETLGNVTARKRVRGGGLVVKAP